MSAQETMNNEEDYKIEMLPEDYPQYDLSFKLIFIGDSSVGKSCLTTKAVKNEFEDIIHKVDNSFKKVISPL